MNSDETISQIFSRFNTITNDLSALNKIGEQDPNKLT